MDSLYKIGAAGLLGGFLWPANKLMGWKPRPIFQKKDGGGALSYCEAQFGLKTAGLTHAEVIPRSKG